MTNYQKICLTYFANKITLTQALEQIQVLPKPWNTEEWKEQKQLILKENCEVCGSNDDLQVQHYWHPSKISVLKKQIINSLVDEKMKNYLVNQDEFKNYIAGTYICQANGCSECILKVNPRGNCPKCKKKIPENEIITYFKIPSKKNLLISTPLDEDRIKHMRYTYKESKRSKVRQELWESSKIQINDFVFRQSYLENLRYLSFVDVKTACKNCSAKENADYINYKSLIANLKAGK